MGKKDTRRHQTKLTTTGNIIPYSGMLLVLLVFVALALLYSVVVPITQGEDELAHYRYSAFIQQSGHLPTTPAERQQAWYRADWPPLYHLLVAWAISPLDTTRPHLKDVGEAPRRRLAGEIFYPRLIIYTEDASWPWQDGILAWHIGRFISVLFSSGALIFTWLTAFELHIFHFNDQGRRKVSTPPSALAPAVSSGPSKLNNGDNTSAPPPEISPYLFATAVMALLAFIPRFLFSSAMLGDDSLFILLSAIFIWLLLRALRGSDGWLGYAAMGLLLGLSVTTKYSTGLLPFTLISVIWWRTEKTGWSLWQSMGRLLWSWLFVIIGASWWFGWISYHFNTIKNDGLFFGLLNPILASGPDVSMRRIFAFFEGESFSGPVRPDAVAEGNFGSWVTYLFQTFWGVPVLEYDPLFPWLYIPALLFCLLAAIGLWNYWRVADPETRVVLGVLLLIVAVLLPFPVLRFFLTHNILETGQGRHILYPAAQSIPILLTLGWLNTSNRITRQRTKHNPQATSQKTPFLLFFLAPVLVLLAWSIFQLAYMHRIYPQPLPVQTTTFNPASIPQPLKQDFGDSIQFLGYDFQPNPEQATINLTLFWQLLAPVNENYRTRVQLVDAAGQSHFTWLSHPLNGRYPTRAWDTGDVIRDLLPLPLAAVPANAYAIQIDLIGEATQESLTEEPFSIIHFDLVKAQPIPSALKFNDNLEYRLWVDDLPVRHRQTIPLSWKNITPNLENAPPNWILIGPDNQPRLAEIAGDATAIFMVDASWPSGDYRLGLAGEETTTAPLLTVANNARLFSLPNKLATSPGWMPVEANFADQIELVGYRLPQRRVEPGGSLPISVVWRGLAPLLPDALTFAVLLNANQQPYGSVDRYPAGYYSPVLWATDEVVPDDFSLPVETNAPPGVYSLHLGQYQLIGGQPESLPLFHNGQPTDNSAVVIGPIKVGGPPPDVIAQNPNPQISVNQSFGPEITLLGYDHLVDNGRPSTMSLTFYWQANAALSTDYTTFFHLRNRANETVAQKDSPPAAGRYPTSLWDEGEIIVDEITLSLDQLPPGEYTPVVGLYNFANGARLPVTGNPANEISLEAIQINE